MWAVVLLLFAGTAEATELDHVRQIERSQEEQNAAVEAEYASLANLEPGRIERESGRVSREGAELSLSLSGGRHTFYRDDESTCLEGVIPARNDGCVQFFFIGERVGRFYMLRARFAAGSDYRLIDEQTGHVTNTLDEPHFSPDGKRFIVASAAGANNSSGLEIWTAGEGAPAQEWTHVPTQYALYYFIDWEGDEDVAIEVATYVDHMLKRLPAHIVLRDGKWLLRGPVESSQY